MLVLAECVEGEFFYAQMAMVEAVSVACQGSDPPSEKEELLWLAKKSM